MDNSENMQDLIGKLNSFAKDNNITQDNINNLFNMLNNQNSQNEQTKTNSDIYNNHNNQNDNNNDDTYNNNSSFNGVNNIDIETIIKMKSIIDKMNTKDDPRSNLLKSLKPYLNDNRKSKVDQYIGLMNMSKVMDVFPFMNGGVKNDK